MPRSSQCAAILERVASPPGGGRMRQSAASPLRPLQVPAGHLAPEAGHRRRRSYVPEIAGYVPEIAGPALEPAPSLTLRRCRRSRSMLPALWPILILALLPIRSRPTPPSSA
jgi:hypothetical protein